ncbi:hypothetical protein [Natronorubrum daqingense]|uniref:Uncharacterized protein n=1 Tax=Natronorubrum daqingense TaxID=588898 RepID=A0A1N7ENR1_9EURY|nr:hypothetical protein [Natronorubrum daqingense]APX97835.1 hypothetical protein BB347_15085 [Natronorubrum daqingense]SIR89727.1 hypothetical protein SAMN05421809_2736 [Natronorubrum daqingense]
MDAKTPAASETDRSNTDAYSRRTVVAVGGTLSVVSLAGCATLMDLFADFVLEDVNVLNDTSAPVSGTLQITAPDDGVVLEESFDLEETDENEDSQVEYGDVWGASGDYEVQLELDDEIEGDASKTESVSVTDPDEEMLIIALGGADADDPIVFAVVTDVSELEEYVDE